MANNVIKHIKIEDTIFDVGEELKFATDNEIGGIKLYKNDFITVDPVDVSSIDRDRVYPIQLTKEGKAVVNVPWGNNLVTSESTTTNKTYYILGTEISTTTTGKLNKSSNLSFNNNGDITAGSINVSNIDASGNITSGGKPVVTYNDTSKKNIVLSGYIQTESVKNKNFTWNLSDIQASNTSNEITFRPIVYKSNQLGIDIPKQEISVDAMDFGVYENIPILTNSFKYNNDVKLNSSGGIECNEISTKLVNGMPLNRVKEYNTGDVTIYNDGFDCDVVILHETKATPNYNFYISIFGDNNMDKSQVRSRLWSLGQSITIYCYNRTIVSKSLSLNFMYYQNLDFTNGHSQGSGTGVCIKNADFPTQVYAGSIVKVTIMWDGYRYIVEGTSFGTPSDGSSGDGDLGGTIPKD